MLSISAQRLFIIPSPKLLQVSQKPCCSPQTHSTGLPALLLEKINSLFMSSGSATSRNLFPRRKVALCKYQG